PSRLRGCTERAPAALAARVRHLRRRRPGGPSRQEGDGGEDERPPPGPRPPDGDGPRTADDATLGCRRLAIIDVAGGAQPLANETGDVIAVCNGEIYNHAALRERLVARGHRFRTRSDTEVLPHLYEERGPDLGPQRGGFFPFPIWDPRPRRLVLARDRMGEKPLYHAVSNGHFGF